MERQPNWEEKHPGGPQETSAPAAPDPFAAARCDMIEKQLRRRGITDARVLAAMAAVPRQEFVPEDLRASAYEDSPLPIGEGQTISQPYIVAAMTSALRLEGGERVLEIGTGCGYQAAVLSRLAAQVFTVELRAPLARAAAERLERLRCTNVHLHCGDGTLGLPEFAPYDAILVAAAAPTVPSPLVPQLAEGGRMIVPVGEENDQELRLLTKKGGRITARILDPCRFVRLVGRYGWTESPRE